MAKSILNISEDASKLLITKRNSFTEIGYSFMAVSLLGNLIFHDSRLVGFAVVGLASGYIGMTTSIFANDRLPPWRKALTGIVLYPGALILAAWILVLVGS